MTLIRRSRGGVLKHGQAKRKRTTVEYRAWQPGRDTYSRMTPTEIFGAAAKNIMTLYWQRLTPEERRARNSRLALKRWERMTPAERRAQALKGHATRRKRAKTGRA